MGATKLLQNRKTGRRFQGLHNRAQTPSEELPVLEINQARAAAGDLRKRQKVPGSASQG